MIPAFLLKHWGSLAIVAGIIALTSAVYLKGRSDEASNAQQKFRDAIFDQLKERNVTDEDISNMPDPDLCRAIGGQLRPDGRCI
ncbi:hypothetical protein [Pararhizobium sp.]|uniref:hypothetical protein n=1 Tax=Pararhizobium sp. TaxID=1977563 RepID=UPI003BA97A48